MKIQIKLNDYTHLSIEATGTDEAIDILARPDMMSITPNPIPITSYLDLNDPAFTALVLEYMSNENSDQLNKNLRDFKISDESFINWIAYCFEISPDKISLEY